MKYDHESKTDERSARTEPALFFCGQSVEILRKPRRKSIVLTMHPDRPLRVGVNFKTSHADILKFLESKKKWIEKNLTTFQQLHSRFPQPQMQAGQKFPFYGELKYLQFADTPKRRLSFAIEDGFLVCYVPQGFKLESAAFFESLRVFYRKQAEEILTQRLNYWVGETGLAPKKVVFRSNQSRWGSCSSARHISLNWKLICQAPALMDYVIVHELCHLVHMNHSDKFWNLLGSYLPTYRETEAVLHDQERLGAFLK